MTDADLIQRYFDAFNAGDADGMAALVADDVTHYPNQGYIRTGKDAFRAFLAAIQRDTGGTTRVAISITHRIFEIVVEKKRALGWQE